MEKTIKNILDTYKLCGMDLEAAVTTNDEFASGVAILGQERIKNIQNAIPMAIEEMKQDEILKSTIQDLDMASLKQLDAILNRHRELPRNGKETSYGMVCPEGLSDKAINLYVAMVRGVYVKTALKCFLDYTSEELDTIAHSSQVLNQQLTEGGANIKTMKFYAAEQAMNSLKDVNSAAVSRISRGLIEVEEKSLGTK